MQRVLAAVAVDRWSYIISLKNLFDSCGFTLFTDEHRVIYESHPVQVAQLESPSDSDDNQDQQRLS